MSVHPARLRNQALYSFINPLLSFCSPSPKVNRVSVMFLMVTVCVRSLSGVPAFRTVVTSHLWATQTSGHPLPLLLTRTPTTVPPVLPLGNHRLPRYEVWTTGHIKDFPTTINSPWKGGNKVGSWLHVKNDWLSHQAWKMYSSVYYFCHGSRLEVLAIIRSALFSLLPVADSKFWWTSLITEGKIQCFLLCITVYLLSVYMCLDQQKEWRCCRAVVWGAIMVLCGYFSDAFISGIWC